MDLRAPKVSSQVLAICYEYIPHSTHSSMLFGRCLSRSISTKSAQKADLARWKRGDILASVQNGKTKLRKAKGKDQRNRQSSMLVRPLGHYYHLDRADGI